jgi:hypothetical protein
MKYILFNLLCITLTFMSCAQTLVVNNVLPRKDVEGNIVDAHDGKVIQFGDTYYWYGTAYAKTTGFVRSNYYQVYSSKNLMQWKKEGALLKEQPSGVYYRPNVIYNKKTKKYVLWYNWYPTLWVGKFGVAVSDKPTGPFTIVNTDVKVKHSTNGVGDFGIFIDEDETAYLSYNTIDSHSASIEKLSDDYQSSTFENSGFITKDCEAGAMFKRKGIYYMLTDYTCCFCTWGTGVRVYTASNAMGPYVLKNNINRYPGTPKASLIDGQAIGNVYEALKKNKEEQFAPIQLQFAAEKTINSIKVYAFTGARNGMCGDTLAKAVHDPIVTPQFEVLVQEGLTWKPVTITKQQVQQQAITNIITYQFNNIKAKSILLKPANNYPYPNIYINEVAAYSNNVLLSGAGSGTMAFVNDVNPGGATPIIPAQQTYVMPINTAKGVEYIWMGDLWGSASDMEKGHDYQYWSKPLQFDAAGNIEPLEFTPEWKIKLK